MTLLQTAVAVSQNTPPLSLGEWVAMIGCALGMGGVIYKTGVNSAETKHVKENSESHWNTIKGTLDKITEFIDESMRLRIQWADWRGSVSREVADARSVADEAKEAAHRARNVAQIAVTNTDKLDERVKLLERSEEDRRVGQTDRRHP